MWETWEFNSNQLDLDYCKKNSILVLGTCETKEPIDMRRYNALLFLKLLFEMNFSGEKVIVVGGPDIFSLPMVNLLKHVGIEVLYVSKTPSCDIKWESFLEKKENILTNFDYLIFANHTYDCNISDQDSFFKEIAKINPHLKVGNISSDLSENFLKKYNVNFYPSKFKGKDAMTFNMYQLGIIPILDLFIAGLSVGSAMSNAMHLCKNINDAAKYVLSNSPAMDFEGSNAWIKD